MVDIDRVLRETGARLRSEQRSPRVDLAAATNTRGRRSNARIAILVGVTIALATGLVALVVQRTDTPTHARVSVAPTNRVAGPGAGKGTESLSDTGVLTGYVRQAIPSGVANNGIVVVQTIDAGKNPGFGEHVRIPPNGQYRLQLPAGRYSVVAYNQSGAVEYPRGEVTVRSGITVRFDLALTPLRLTPTTTAKPSCGPATPSNGYPRYGQDVAVVAVPCGCPAKRVTPAPPGDTPIVSAVKAAESWLEHGGWAPADTQLEAVYKVGDRTKGQFSSVFARNVPLYCGIKVAAASYGVELGNATIDNTARQQSLVVAHFARGWEVWGAYP